MTTKEFIIEKLVQQSQMIKEEIISLDQSKEQGEISDFEKYLEKRENLLDALTRVYKQTRRIDKYDE